MILPVFNRVYCRIDWDVLIFFSFCHMFYELNIYNILKGPGEVLYKGPPDRTYGPVQKGKKKLTPNLARKVRGSDKTAGVTHKFKHASPNPLLNPLLGLSFFLYTSLSPSQAVFQVPLITPCALSEILALHVLAVCHRSRHTQLWTRYLRVRQAVTMVWLRVPLVFVVVVVVAVVVVSCSARSRWV